ncbi:FAD-dependent oxidoreductase [Actinomadura flavalba]|uniref:FAD-dependent oxidoreductase n=1 Tax=Actinomadura flavalba TaxID=1120938 RepID=UPI00037817FD|nr:NAD(P)/FAD-dependent oxidoreductase [Actinomadura flavalba]
MAVIVVGAGVGGLTAALLLARCGRRVTVLERAPDPGRAGAALALFPNGLSVLYGLGLRDALREQAYATRSGAIRLGSHVVRADLPDFGGGLDHALVLTRARLADVLLAAVRAEPRVTLRLGARAERAWPDGRVRVDGVDLRADLVIGADGVGSVVRGGGRFGVRRTPTSTLTLRALVPGEPFRADAAEHWGAAGLAIGVPVGGGRSYLALSAARGPLRAAMEHGDLDGVRRHASALLPGADTAFAAIPSFDAFYRAPVERVRCRRWADGRLVLLGDAAHAMAPHLGQGANGAILDAFALTVAPSLTAYERRRRATTTRLALLADAYRRTAETLTAPGVRHVRDRAVRAGHGATGAYLRLIQQDDPARVQAAVRSLPRG